MGGRGPWATLAQWPLLGVVTVVTGTGLELLFPRYEDEDFFISSIIWGGVEAEGETEGPSRADCRLWLGLDLTTGDPPSRPGYRNRHFQNSGICKNSRFTESYRAPPQLPSQARLPCECLDPGGFWGTRGSWVSALLLSNLPCCERAGIMVVLLRA